MPHVAVLSEALINKIAAGEVVERPASVVKELVENSIDAGANAIHVVLAGGGLTLVSVIDDGYGMSRDDAVLAMTRHATSKLKDLEGLFSIRSLGFRGEAIPAIAAVSRFSILTSERGAVLGTRIGCEGGGPLRVEDAAAAGGTTVRAEDLFFNTPARRKFMRGESTELRHCEEAVIRVALAHPHVGFHVEHEGRQLFSSPARDGDLRERIAQALGPEIHRHLREVEERRLGMTVRGFIAAPEFHLATARGVYTFVNGRYVRDRGLNAAIQRAFGDVLPGGRQPALVIFIDLDPRDVDVNVHPQKLEVRFQDGRGVAEALFAALGRGLKRELVPAPSIEPNGSGAAQYALAVERFLTRAAEGTVSEEASRVADRPPAFGEARPDINTAPPPGYFSRLRFLGALAQRFWLFEGLGGSLVVVDPHAAVERVRLGEYLRLAKARAATPLQAALFSASVDLPSPEARLLEHGRQSLEQVGIELDAFGGSSFAVRALPPGLEAADVRALLLDLAPLVPVSETSADLERLAKVMACHAAKSSPLEVPAEARRALLDALDSSEFHVACRHDRIVIAELPLLELERRTRGLALE